MFCRKIIVERDWPADVDEHDVVPKNIAECNGCPAILVQPILSWMGVQEKNSHRSATTITGRFRAVIGRDTTAALVSPQNNPNTMSVDGTSPKKPAL